MLIAGEIRIDLQHDLESDLARFLDQRRHVVGTADGRIGLEEVHHVDGGQRRHVDVDVAVSSVGVVERSRLEQRRERNRAGAERLDVFQIGREAL